MYEMEGLISTSDSCLYFLNRSIPFFHQIGILLKCRKQRLIKIDRPFVDELSGLAMRLTDVKTGCTYVIKVNFIRNTGFLDVTNNPLEPLIFIRSRH